MLMMHLEGMEVVLSTARFFIRLRIDARMRAREVSREPSRFVRRTSEMSFGSVLGRTLDVEIPAALMRMSTGCWAR